MKETAGFIISNMRLALFMIRGSLSVLLPFEIVYRLIAVLGITPLGSVIISSALKLSGIDFITEENLVSAISNPFVILSFIVVFMILGMYTVFEISFLTLTYNQRCQGLPLGFFRMLGVSARDAVRVLRPRNYPLLLLIILVLPISSSLLLSSLFKEVSIPNFMFEIILQTPLYSWGVIIILTLSMLLVLRYIFVLHEYTLEDEKTFTAAKCAVKLAKGKRIKILWTLLVWQGIAWLVSTLASTVIKTGLSAIAVAFSSDERIYSSLLALNITVGEILKFAVPSFLVFSSYAIISAMYFKGREEKDGVLPQVVLPVDTKRGKMNFQLCVLTVLTALVLLVGFSYKNAHNQAFSSNGAVQVVAHRGYNAPENTLPAFQAAIDMGADYIELDVQETADGEIIVFHDSNTKRLTGVKANVWELSLKEIQKLDAGRYSKEYKGTKIPTLREVIDLCRGKIMINIEMKINGHQKKLESSVDKILKEENFEDQVVVSSLNKNSLQRFKDVNPNIPCGYIVSVALGKYVDAPWADFFSVEQSLVTESLVNEAHKNGKSVSAWTVNRKKSADRIISCGVDSIITDEPIVIKEAIIASDNPLTRLLWSIE